MTQVTRKARTRQSSAEPPRSQSHAFCPPAQTRMSPRARLILVIGLLLFAAISARLRVWQLHRLAQRRASNAVAQVARQAPEIDLAARGPEPLGERRVRASGTYDRAHELVLRGQVFREIPGL